MKRLFIDCSLGLAGDMLAGALLELFSDRNGVINRLNNLGIPGVEYAFSTIQKYSITGTHFSVKYCGIEEDGCQNEFGYPRYNGAQNAYNILAQLNLPEAVKSDARRVYSLVAEAESKAHGYKVEQIHFHELGTMDAIADICAVCFMLHELEIDHIVASPIRTGFGTIECVHGTLRVPAPATAALLSGTVNFAGDIEGELCTPTGTALVKYFADRFDNVRIDGAGAVGYGIGKRDFGRLTCVRVTM